ncbi:hypothetical protein [Pediococcus pentosaceus]
MNDYDVNEVLTELHKMLEPQIKALSQIPDMTKIFETYDYLAQSIPNSNVYQVYSDSLMEAQKIFQRQLEIWEKSTKKFREQLEHDYPKQVVMINRLHNLGWSLGYANEITFEIVYDYETYSKMSNKKLDEFMEKNLSEKVIQKELRAAANFTNEYKEVINMMSRVIVNVKESWIIMYPQLFAILDRFFVFQGNRKSLNNTEYTQREALKNYKNELLLHKNSQNISLYVYIKTIDYLFKLWKSQPFNSDNLKLTRNSVQHGRYNPKNYTFKQFAQLVLALSTLAQFNK